MSQRWTSSLIRVSIGGVVVSSLATGSYLLWSARQADSATAQPSVVISPAPSGGEFHNDEMVTVTIAANSLFAPNAKVNILECADPGGSSDNLPKSVSSCDGNTIQGATILTQPDGSISVSAYPLYALPNHALGEQANWQPVCNVTNKCVLYVGENQEDFTQPKVFSAPFAISTDAQSGTASSSSTGASTSASSASTTTITTPATTPSTSVSATTPPATSSTAATTSPVVSLADSAPAALASTGPPVLLPWLLVGGSVLSFIGLAGKRFWARAVR